MEEENLSEIELERAKKMADQMYFCLRRILDGGQDAQTTKIEMILLCASVEGKFPIKVDDMEALGNKD